MLRVLWLMPLVLGALTGVARAQSPPRLPVLSSEEAWKRLPGAPAAAQPLPAWARMLAGPLPLTTARMLELDAQHRSGDRLDARLRGLVRWAAADANGCASSKAVAAADLRRAGLGEADLKALAAHPDRLPELDRAAMAFARTMMREAHAVTDDEVKRLLALAGEERVVALVALLAHAAFQDRILLALNAPVEPQPLPPVTAKFERPPARKPAPHAEAAPRETAVPRPNAASAEAEWLNSRANLEKQRARSGRIRVPSREEVLRRLGEGHPAAWQTGILWSRVCYGFQPELTEAWFDCVAAFRQEAPLDRVFQNALFWVVTQALQCFY